jgi:hypothetical protein
LRADEDEAGKVERWQVAAANEFIAHEPSHTATTLSEHIISG